MKDTKEKATSPAPRATKRRPMRKTARPPGPTLTVTFTSIDVKHNGWPGDEPKEMDLSLILQIENPAAPEENRVLSSDRLPFKAYSGVSIHASELSPAANGVPLFRGAVAVSDHVNLHVRFFVERGNAVGPILGAALNTVIGELGRRIPLLPEPVKDALHIQIGKTIATELARANVIVPVEASMKGVHPVTIALVAPRTIPGFYTSAHEPGPAKKGIAVNEGDLVALLHVDLELALPAPRA
jgi:hypothetical protein